MITAQVISVLLYVPFVLAAIITGIIYCIKGYKQGLYRALISLGVTFLSVGLSLLLSRLLSLALSGLVAKLVPRDLFGEMGSLRDILVSLLSGLVQSGVAILLFGLFLLIFLIVLKIVWNHIKKDALLPKNNGMKWGGLGVRLVDTVIVAFLLLVPLYGTLATYVPPVESVIKITEGSDSAAAEYLSAVSENGMVSLYKGGPSTWIQGGLGTVKIGDVSVNLKDVIDVSGTAVEKFSNLSTCKDRKELMAAISDISKFLRDDVVEEEWFYSVMSEAKNALLPALDTLSEEEKVIMEQVLKVFDLPQEQFATSGVAILDFVSYAVDSGAADFLETGDPEDLPDDFPDKLKTLVEGDEVSKSLIISMVQDSFIDTEKQEQLLQDAATAEEQEKVLKEIKDEAAKKAEEFIDQFLNEGLSSGNE
ncbi:MAG: hypothetical protein J6B86_04180 [Clostridia bacterium]|nr:hypothetical protein [Clostridia bacterium]